MSKSALITGASGVIGKAVSIALAESGFDVVLCYRSNEAAVVALCSELAANGHRSRALQLDVVDRDGCRAAIEADMEQHGAYYGVVCNAGIHRDGPFPGLSGDEWDEVIDTNLSAFYNVLQPITLPMIRARQGGRIVTISSIAGVVGNRGQVNYSASKAGLIGASKALATELGKRQITVNCVAPGLIESEMLNNLPVAELLTHVPLQRLGRPEEVAAVVAFLFSEQAGYMTRQVLSVNGGLPG
jgi:3-oxoacyl-[acyl-carrier protein] reductase